MNVEKLKEFRAKLIHAKDLCSLRGFDDRIVIKFLEAGLTNLCDNTGSGKMMPDDVYVWYVNPCRAPAERAAMWDNSIAAVDARIAKAK